MLPGRGSDSIAESLGISGGTLQSLHRTETVTYATYLARNAARLNRIVAT